MVAAPVLAWTAIGLSAASAVMQGVQAKNTANYNAKMADRQAEETRLTAAAEEDRQRARSTKVLSAMRTRIAASGVDLEGSPLLALEEGAANAEYDALAIRHAGSSQEARLRAQAALERSQGKAALFGGVMQAGATVLGGKSRIDALYGQNLSGIPSGQQGLANNLALYGR